MARTPCVFITFDQPDGALSARDRSRLSRIAKGITGVSRALAFVPLAVTEEHPFRGDGSGPALALYLEFMDEACADAAMASNGGIAQLARDGLESLPSAEMASERLTARSFPVTDSEAVASPGPARCTLLVEYPGTCDDVQAWLEHYDRHHPPIMGQFPKIREVSTFWPQPEARNDLPGGRHVSLQRNKVVFDSAEDLVAALASPVMHEMRADFAHFPRFSAPPRHHVMTTIDLLAGDA